MNILAEPFCIPKRGNSVEENDDAVWPKQRSEYQESTSRFAVADGATESLFAGRWAETLVRAVGENRLSALNMSRDVSSLRTEWRDWVATIKLPWYAEEKASQGAYSALVGIEIGGSESEQDSDGSWSVMARGDSCFFHVRGDEIRDPFPLENSLAFDSRPFLLGSKEGDEQLVHEHLAHRRGLWQTGDVFYLMTDALACWFLRQVESGSKPLEVLQQHASSTEPGRFPIWIESLRDEGVIRNDDSTLLRISVR